MTAPSVSIFIRARNEAEALGRTLPALWKQNRRPDEIVVLDNASTDGTPEVARELGARVAFIHQQDFSYGGALNRCLQDTRGSIVVFLSAHSPPTHADWLANLLAPVEGGAAAAFGSQVPVPGVNHLEEWVLLRTFPRRPRRWKRWLGLQKITFSNANAAVRRSLLETQPFREDLEFAEDVEWSRRIQKQGEEVVYVPSAPVEHSHPFQPGGLERRMEAVGRAMARQGQGTAYLNPILVGPIVLGTLGVDLVYCCLRGYWRTLPAILGYRREYFGGLRRGLKTIEG